MGFYLSCVEAFFVCSFVSGYLLFPNVQITVSRYVCSHLSLEEAIFCIFVQCSVYSRQTREVSPSTWVCIVRFYMCVGISRNVRCLV